MRPGWPGAGGRIASDRCSFIRPQPSAPSCAIAAAYRYDAWGVTLAAHPSVSPPVNPFRYRGLLDVSPDASNPLYDMAARNYSPGLGVFTSLDSVRGSAADPLSMNRYLYAEGNPATLIDPTGHAVTTTTLCSPYADYCNQGGSSLYSTSYNSASATTDPPGNSAGNPSATNLDLVVRPDGLVLWPDGTLAEQGQFDTLAAACSSVWGPAPEGSACEVWQKTSERLGRSDADTTWVSEVAIGAIEEALQHYGKELESKASINLRLSYVAEMQSLADFKPRGAGALYQLSMWQADVGRLLKRASLVTTLIAATLDAHEQFQSDLAHGVPLGYSLLRGATKGATIAAGGVGGAWIGGAAAAGLCALFFEACGPAAFAGAIAGGYVGSTVAFRLTDYTYQVIDLNAGMR